MAILFPALGIAFVAVCVWLSVRVVNRKERWAKCTLAAMLAIPLLYVASFVPGCWLVGRDILSQNSACVFYRPLLRLRDKSELFQELTHWVVSQNDDAYFGYVRIYVSDYVSDYANSDW